MPQMQQNKEIKRPNTRARSKRLSDNILTDNSLSESNLPTRKKTRKTENENQETVNISIKENMTKRTTKGSTRQNRTLSLSMAKIDEITTMVMPNSTTPIKPISIRKSGHNTKSDTTQTPKSSPVIVNLSPRRSIKTPKTSPKELASPKSHSVLYAEISPRKLLSQSDSPLATHKTEVDMSLNLGPKLEISSHDDSVSQTGKSGSGKLSKSSSIERSKFKTSSIGLKHGVRRFSKSPKIVLKTPKPKSKKSKSPKLQSKTRWYSLNARVNTGANKSVRMSLPKTETKKKAVLKLNKSETSSLPLNSSIEESLLQDIMMRKKPVVVLQRLSMAYDTVATESSCPAADKKPIKPSGHSPLNETVKTLRSKKSVSKQLDLSEKRSPAKKEDKLTSRSLPKNVNQENLQPLRHWTPAEVARKSSGPLMSSTPHDNKQKRSALVISPLDVSSKSFRRSSPRVKANQSPSTNGVPNPAIEDHSELVWYHSDNTESDPNKRKKNGVLEEESDNKKDGTYELEEPKTPHLREKVKKRDFPSEDKQVLQDTAQEVKKNARVRFASSAKIIESTAKSSIRRVERGRIERVRIPAHKSNPVKKSLFTGENTPEKKNKSLNGSGKQLNSRTTNRIIGGTVFANAFSPKKPDALAKGSATKKVPDFAKIHGKLFEKSESLVDVKKRHELRHKTLTSTKLNTPKARSQRQPLTNEATNGGNYNRFGFKLRKQDAVDCILKKRQLYSGTDQQQKNRDMIKGVRMNRRFELQMKARNLKI